MESIVDLEKTLGGIPYKNDLKTLIWNTEALEYGLSQLKPGQVLVIPKSKSFFLHHGILVEDLHDVVIQIDGTLRFQRDYHNVENYFDDRTQEYRPMPCLKFQGGNNITITSTTLGSVNQHQVHHDQHATDVGGILDGGGPEWWGIPFLGYVQTLERRPKLLAFNHTTNLMIEHLILRDAPFYSLDLISIDTVHVHDVSILNRRTRADSHSLLDLSAFNTDGIDVSGSNVYIHDVNIWTQDDCLAVKDNWYGNQVSSNMTFERIHGSGLGFVIGSIAGSSIKDIVFRDSILYKSVKGIYLKFREVEKNWMWQHGAGTIENILFENVTMIDTEQWPIWIGPAQQTGGRSANPCAASPCSLCWPELPFATCSPVEGSKYRNITLRDVEINQFSGNAGVLLGSSAHGIQDIVFDNVRVSQDPEIRTTIRDLFPTLSRQSLHDPNIALTRVALVLVLFFIFLACFGMRQYKLTNFPGHRSGYVPIPNTVDATETTPKKPKMPAQCIKILFIISLIMLGALIIQGAFVWSHASNFQLYFACDGVVNAKAIGNTWPVPSCFQDWMDFKKQRCLVCFWKSIVFVLCGVSVFVWPKVVLFVRLAVHPSV